jgi:hypothetical protein
MTKQITVHFDICYVPLPPEKRFEYNEAHRLLHELMLKAWLARKPEEGSHTGLPQPESHLAQAGSPVGADGIRLLPEALPGAGVTTPSTGDLHRHPPFEKPAGMASPSLQAQNTTGISG